MVLENNICKEKNMKVLDLFSGIGGFSLGLESTGHFETIAFVEKDEFCQKVLRKNFKNIPIEGDIRNVKGDRYQADVVTGGFPCQPFSIAGKRKGTDDDRYLWDETIRVVRECRPKWFIGENVDGLVNIQNGMVLRQVQNDLEKEGFEVQCLVIPASGIGAWHQRKRIWIIGCNVSNSNINSKTKRREYENDEKTSSSREHFKERGNGNGGQGYIQSTWQSKDVPNSDSKLRRRWGAIGKNRANKIWGFSSKKEEQARNDIRSETIRCNDIFGKEKNLQHTHNERFEELNLSTEPKKSDINNREYDSTTENKTWWQTQSDLCGVPNGVSYGLDKNRANRIKSLGNSIVPQIARELGKAIIKAEKDV
jgi:DNA (cytosine-5)-methyltransferase 1